jgi:hypothetical protein
MGSCRCRRSNFNQIRLATIKIGLVYHSRDSFVLKGGLDSSFEIKTDAGGNGE